VTPEEKRLAIAEALAAAHVNKEWVFSPDHWVPTSARGYAVYDGVQVIGGGLDCANVPRLVRRAKVPIVFFLPGISKLEGGE